MSDEAEVHDEPVLDAAREEPDEAVELPGTPEGPAPNADPEVFPREVVEKLRQENGKYRQRAQQADTLAQRLHLELVRATGRLADPTDLPFDADHLEGSDKLSLALDELLERKPHLATRKPAGDIGQGQRGTAPESFSLLGLLKERT